MAKTLRQILDETSKKKMWIYAMDAKTEKDDIERRYDEEKNFDDMDSDEQLKDLKRRTAEHKAGKPSSLKDIIKYTFKNGPDNIRRKQRNRKQGIDTAIDKLSGWK